MIKRASWFVSGAVAGVAGAAYAKRKARGVAEQLAPAQVARTVSNTARARVRDVAEALRDGRVAMRAKEAELRARRDGQVLDVSEQLAPGDELLVDGRPAQHGQVIVLRPARADEPGRNHPVMRQPRRRSRSR